MLALRHLPMLYRAGVVLVALAALWGGLELWKRTIYQRGYADASADCAERARVQEEAIRKVKDAAAQQQELLEQAIELLKKDNADALEQIETAGAADPLGADACISADGVRRLNAIR